MSFCFSSLIYYVNTDKSAEQRLNEYENANYAEFAHALAKELATDGKNAAARQLASLYLKNMLNAKDPTIQVNKHERWKQLDANARHAVKEEILKAFRSADQGIPRMAAVTSSEIAAVELPYNEWPQFLPTILEYANGAQTPESVKVASIECLGFTAERIFNLSDVGEEKEIPDEAMNNMLTAIVNGVQSGGTPAIKFASITALRNALYFCSKNMEKKQERDAIMSTICDAASIPNDAIRSVAFDCLAQIAYLYYNNLQDYMTKIFELTAAAIRQFDDVSKNAIEFWSTICDTEQERLDEAAEYAELGDPVPADRNCFRYAEAALEALVPILLEALTKQEEDDEEDMFNVHMAATICLTLMSQTVEDKIVNYVMSFVTQNINNGDWRLRDAAIMAFTCILDGPTSETIGPFVSQAMPALLQAVSDGHPMVRDTTAHCISQICKLHVRAIPPEMFPTLLQELMSKCGDQSPKVAAQACAAIHNLANAFQDQSHEQHQTNALSQFMSDLLSTLWKVCDRNDSNESNLRVASMEAISILVQVSALDQKPLLVQLLPAVVERLNHALNQSSLTNEEQESKEQLQGLLCALIQVLYQKLEKHEVAPHTDRAMTMLLGVLQAQNATCHEEAFAAIAAVADLLEDDFCVSTPFLCFSLNFVRMVDAHYVFFRLLFFIYSSELPGRL